MPAQLVSLAEGPNILLDKPIVLIGRHEECDIQLNSRKISRKHCCIAQVHDYLVIRDLGSTNGVRINGVRTNEGMLHTGDELTIGNFRYQIQGDSSPLPALARAAAGVRQVTQHAGNLARRRRVGAGGEIQHDDPARAGAEQCRLADLEASREITL